MKTALIAAALALTAPGLALAQAPGQTRPATTGSGVSAGTLPNTMDGPAAAQATRPAARPAPAPAQTPAPPPAEPAEASTPEQVAAAETALKATIAAAQSGTMNYDAMTENVAEQVREREASLISVIAGFGALQDIEHRGQENGAELFLATFAEAVTQWIVGLDSEGQIAILLFREAPPIDSAD